MYNWNLNKIYNGYDSKEYKEDVKALSDTIELSKNFDYSKKNDAKTLEDALKLMEKQNYLLYSLYNYVSLRLSTESEDIESLKASGKIMSFMEDLTEPSLAFNKYLKSIDDLDGLISSSNYLKEYRYVLKKSYDESKRMLSDETEIAISKLKRSSSSAWERLFETLTSTLEVEYEGKTITLPEVRNLAYSNDEDTRRKAYEAELKSYSKIDKSIAATLSSIKQETTTMAKLRGFDGPIEKTLDQTGMTKKTLDALISSIEEYLPEFRRYFKRKGEILGHKNGLPFYDLFAPVGKCDKKFSVEEANDYLVSRFSTFNTEISSLMRRAMDNEWIDYMPHAGKVGGAFCADAKKIKEARILTNFDGSFGSVITLAHELGHAYHAYLLKDSSIFFDEYPMQLAETASTFNETFIKDDAMKNASSKDELLNILETSISDDAQVIVDILSRFYFEKSVFEKSDESSLSSEELCNLMKDAQLRSYGDGLDPKYLHPYMWCCKSHYYSADLSFYNFPYAFGQLFAYGLYGIYEEKGESFFELYKKILKDSGRMPIRECVLEAGIDVEDKKFWESSLELIKKKIDKFIELTE